MSVSSRLPDPSNQRIVSATRLPFSPLRKKTSFLLFIVSELPDV
jgi:hypothetical protein